MISYTAFLTHNWGKDESNRDNHARVVRFKKELEANGITNLWLDEERLQGDIVKQMADGIDQSKLIIVFITKAYISKVNGEGPNGQDDNCSREFRYAINMRGSENMIVVLMEMAKLTGPVGFNLCNHFYHSYEDDSQLSQCAGKVSDEIRRRLQLSTKTSGTCYPTLVRNPVRNIPVLEEDGDLFYLCDGRNWVKVWNYLEQSSDAVDVKRWT